MAKIYSGGIEIATGFKQLSPVPIDDRCAVKLDSDLDLLENKCKGLMSYSDESKTVFFYDGNEWVPFLKEGDSIEWGEIEGNISNQADLIGALNLKADDNTVVKLTGNQTVAGVKTFSSFPITPSSAPTTNYQTANKKYVDDQIAASAPDYSFLTDNRHIKKVGSDLADSNIQDTAIGSEVLGRLDSTTTVERRVATTASYSFIIDLNNPSGHYDLTLTGNTTIDFSNMIETNQSTVITLVVGGNYSLLFPIWLKPMNNNDDYYVSSVADVNLITILIRNGGGSPQGMYSLTNVNLA